MNDNKSTWSSELGDEITARNEIKSIHGDIVKLTDLVPISMEHLPEGRIH